ncbi:uncharacterized protein LOC118195836 [Stegodyphus dumicola]|uniref:uncharacterized protein LOC118195836 n=1 Tax=Stegodyphus dumicola TaxID=202533 RepID=UPI0015B139C8|nr:uncharacterized protein LOC118195836 [Stegodyphus dumicola]
MNDEDNSTIKDIDNLSFILSQLSICDKDVHRCINDVFTKEALYCKRQVSMPLFFMNYLHFALRIVGIVFKYILACIFTIVFMYLLITSHNTVQKFVMRNCQNYIYPTMRTLRIWTLPLLQRYEFLSDWHEEECLVKNPFYYELPLDCWPCEDVRTLVDLTGFNNYSNDYVYNEQPFIVKDSLNIPVSFNDLLMLYEEHNIVLDSGTAKFLCSESDFCSPRDVFTKKAPAKNAFQVMWKINRVAAARVVRKIFPRPYFIPNSSEVALERYLYLSGAEAPQFFLPLTDFANVWVAQGQGYRLIVLDPSEPCISNCSTVSVLLRPRDVLYYNWQFWRPRSRPANFSEDISITYVGSFY